MADNTRINGSLDPAQPLVADDEVSYSGQDAKVQIVQLAIVTGAEGSRSLTKLGDFSVTLADLLTAVQAQLPAALILGGLKTAAVETTFTATVPTTGGGQTSNSVDSAGCRNLALVPPLVLSGTDITFQVSADGTLFYQLRDILNTVVTMSLTAGAAHDLPGELLAWRYFKIITTTPQVAQRVFTIVGRS